MTSLCLIAGTSAAAHPHIFVDAGLEVITDQEGRMTHVRVTWAYDALYSLLITEDYGMDQDGDAVLTEAEEAALNGFDMAWIEGFNGDLVAQIDGQPLRLGRPEAHTAVMREGRIVTTHLRAVQGTPALGNALLSLKPFDRTFYTAYDVTGHVRVQGLDGCMIEKELPNIDEELEKLQVQLAKLGTDQDAIEMGFPEVGEAFATEVRITCADF
ncbi:MAG: DUF1007 family protein [Pseudomonadota bacterium]